MQRMAFNPRTDFMPIILHDPGARGRAFFPWV